jgi:hypothetical protein
MDSDPGTGGTRIGGISLGIHAAQYTDPPEARWIAWALWSAISLVLVLLTVFGAGFDTGLLPGWAAGIIVAAMLLVFGE